MSSNLTPARIVTPGRILKRELDARGMTQKELAEILKRPPQAISEIIQGHKQITPETARELSAALGISEKFWLNLEVNYQLHLAKKKNKEEEIARRSRLYELAPISEIMKRKWVGATDSSAIEELEKEVCNFLGIDSPQETPQLQVSYRNSQIKQAEIKSEIAWLKRVEFLASQQDLPEFRLDKLKTAIPEIISYSEKENSVAQIPTLLESLGIHFVIVSKLPQTFIDGAAFYLNERPVIALTLRYDRIDSFWFTLMHELGHIFAGHQDLYLDNLEKLDENIQEEEANKLASNWLISAKKLESFIIKTRPQFSEKKINSFAKTQKRHPGIILGRLHYDREVPYRNLRKMLVKVSPFLREWIDN